MRKGYIMLTKKILIVDDNPNMSTLLSDILEIFDFQGFHAGDGNEALDQLRHGKYDMVFTDLRMPNMDGIDLLKAIKLSIRNYPWWLLPDIQRPKRKMRCSRRRRWFPK